MSCTIQLSRTHIVQWRLSSEGEIVTVVIQTPAAAAAVTVVVTVVTVVVTVVTVVVTVVAVEVTPI